MLPWRIPTASFMVGTAWLVRGGGFRRTLIVPRGSLGGCRWKPGKRRPAGFTAAPPGSPGLYPKAQIR